MITDQVMVIMIINKDKFFISKIVPSTTLFGNKSIQNFLFKMIPKWGIFSSLKVISRRKHKCSHINHMNNMLQKVKNAIYFFKKSKPYNFRKNTSNYYTNAVLYTSWMEYFWQNYSEKLKLEKKKKVIIKKWITYSLAWLVHSLVK